MAKNTGKQYEELTQAVFNYLNNVERVGIEKIAVEQNKIIQGKTTAHQIDVYWEFRVGIITYKVIIQSKDWNSSVKKENMLAFKAIIDDIPNTSGIFVSRSGFQSGAKEVALANGIRICELRNPIDSDWDGLMKDIHIEIHTLSPRFDEIKFFVDGYWAKNNGISESFSGTQQLTDTGKTIIFANGEKRMLKDVFADISNNVGIGFVEKSVTYSGETYLDLEYGLKWKITGFEGKFGMTESKFTTVIRGGSLIDCVLKEIDSGKVHMLNKANIGYQR
jgi:hypothetical protein